MSFVRKKMKTGIKLALFFAVLLFGGHRVWAAEVPQVELLSCQSTAADCIELVVKNPGDKTYSYDIYRADSETGTYALRDTVNYYGSIWSSYGSEEEMTSGIKKKVTCFRSSSYYYFYDTGLKLNTTYYYKVQLRDYSEESGTVSKTGAAKTALAQPKILRGYTSEKYVKLNWSKVGQAQGYYIYRKTGKTWKKIGTVKKQSTISYTDKKAAANKTYQYRIKAYRKVGSKVVTSSAGTAFTVTTKAATVKGNYKRGTVYGPSLNTSQLQEVRAVVQSFNKNYISSKMSTYDKLYTAMNYLRNTCSYAYRGWQYNGANTAWGALVYGEAQCSGYARAFKALCDSLRIPCYYVHANTKSINPSHQWNEVKLNGKWYIVDPQGGFFLVSAATYKTTGMRWNENAYPKCTTDYK